MAEPAPPQVLVETTVGELAEYITSGSRDWSKYYAESGAIFIRTQDINRNKLSLDDIAYVRLPERVEGKRSLVRKGDLLITITGANVGKVAAVESEISEAYVSQSVCLVRLKDPNLAKFIQLQLIARTGNKSSLEAMAYGLGRPVLNLENIRSAPVKIGPSHLRSGIVAEIEKQFSRLDEAAANLKHAKSNLARYKNAVLKSAIEGRLVPTEAELARREGRIYENAQQLLGRIISDHRTSAIGRGKYKESGVLNVADLPGLPEGWAWATCAQVCDPVASGSTPTPDKMFAGSGDIPLIKVYNLTFDGSLDFTKKPTFVGRETHEGLLARSRVIPGDVLMNIVGPPLGKISIVPAFHPEWNINQAIVIFRPTYAISNRLLALWLLSRPVLTRLERTAKATAGQFNLQVSTCRKLLLPLPPLAEQYRIVDEVERLLSVAREVEVEIDTNLSRAQRLRVATLARAFDPGAADACL